MKMNEITVLRSPRVARDDRGRLPRRKAPRNDKWPVMTWGDCRVTSFLAMTVARDDTVDIIYVIRIIRGI